MRAYNPLTITLSEVLKRWRDGDKNVLYWLTRDYPGLMVWLEKDLIELIDKTFGHARARTINRHIRDWSGVEPEKPRGKPRQGSRPKDAPAHLPPPLQSVPLDVAGGEKVPFIPAVDEPAQTVDEALRQLEQEERDGKE